LLRPGSKAASQFTWPKDQPEPRVVMQRVVELMHWHQSVLDENFRKMGRAAVEKVQARWCCAENPLLFRERWEKLFEEFSEADKVRNCMTLLIFRLTRQKCPSCMIR